MLALGACGGDSGPSGTTTINSQQAQVIGDQATSQIGDITSGLTNFSFSGGGLGGGFFSRAALRMPMSTLERVLPPSYRSQLARIRAGGCDPAVAGDSADSDGDGIENNVTYTFSAANCFYQDSAGNGFAVTGSVSVEDTDGGATLWGFGLDLNRLKVLFYTDSSSAGFEWDGTYGATVTALSASTSRHFVTKFHANNQTPFVFRDNWTLTFTPDSGSIDPTTQGTLPDGTFDVTGSYNWSGNFGQADGDWSFNLSTPTPLHWSSACDGFDPPFNAGQLRAAINGHSNVGFTVDYGPNCGDTSVNTFDANAA
jgi:hypothetical protein